MIILLQGNRENKRNLSKCRHCEANDYLLKTRQSKILNTLSESMAEAIQWLREEI
jgi:hypothetical protein